MLKRSSWPLVLIAVIIMLSSTVTAKTWRLAEDKRWLEISEDEQNQYLMAVTRIKEMISNGRPIAEETLIKLKESFPETVKQEYEAFAQAERLLAKGKLDKAVRSYNKFLDEYPRTDLYEPALDRQFQVATAYLAGKKRRVLAIFTIKGYNEGIKIMEKIEARAGDAPIAQQAMLSIAKSYEKRSKFTEAYETWSQISSRWPGGDLDREALLGMARNMHAAYKGPKFDATSLISARGYYQDYQIRYPEHAEEIGIEQILADITQQIAHKQYAVGEYYDRTGSKLAANLYYQQIANNWPDSNAAKLVDNVDKKEAAQEKQK